MPSVRRYHDGKKSMSELMWFSKVLTLKFQLLSSKLSSIRTDESLITMYLIEQHIQPVGLTNRLYVFDNRIFMYKGGADTIPLIVSPTYFKKSLLQSKLRSLCPVCVKCATFKATRLMSVCIASAICSEL